MGSKDFENLKIGLRDLVEQLLTLSTGIIALTITFSKDFIDLIRITTTSKYLIDVSWILFLFSIIFGVELNLLPTVGGLVQQCIIIVGIVVISRALDRFNFVVT